MKVAALGMTALLAVALMGCSTTETVYCVEYIGPLSPAEAGDEASLVVVGTVSATEDTRDVYGEAAPLHRVSIETVIKGELPVDTPQIEVASTPQTCNGGDVGGFPEGDPLEVEGRVELFLVVEDGGYRTLTPWDGVEAAPDGRPLPWRP